MFLTRLKITLAVLLLIAVVASGAGFLLPAQATETPQPKQAERPASQNQDRPATEPRPVNVQQDGQVRSLAWSADGKTLATVGIVYEVVVFGDGAGNPTDKGAVFPNSTIKLWDAKGKLQRSLSEERHTFIAALAFSADAKTAAVSTSKHILTANPDDPLKYETEVRVMDAQAWALKHKVKADGFASALAFSPDGTRLALGGRSRLADNGSFLKLWDVQKEKAIGGTA